MFSWIGYVLVVIVVGAIANRVFKSGVIACVISGVLSTFLFQLIVFLQMGFLDKFVLIAVAVLLPIGLIVSGLEIIILRKNSRKHQ